MIFYFQMITLLYIYILSTFEKLPLYLQFKLKFSNKTNIIYQPWNCAHKLTKLQNQRKTCRKSVNKRMSIYILIHPGTWVINGNVYNYDLEVNYTVADCYRTISQQSATKPERTV